MKSKLEQLKEERRQLYIKIYDIREERRNLLFEQRPLTLRLWEIQKKIKVLE